MDFSVRPHLIIRNLPTWRRSSAGKCLVHPSYDVRFGKSFFHAKRVFFVASSPSWLLLIFIRFRNVQHFQISSYLISQLEGHLLLKRLIIVQEDFLDVLHVWGSFLSRHCID